MAQPYDIVVAGGSIAGLTFAAEAAKRGARVLVFEEHREIGEPEKCDGLVSLRGLKRLGYPPERHVIQSEIKAAVVHSPSGRLFSVNAESLEVVVLDRSAYDLELAEAALSYGGELKTGTRSSPPLAKGKGVEVSAGGSVFRADYFVDATGPSSSPRRGILPAAKYEVEGEWVREHTVELFMNAERYPGFFAWVIPQGGHMAKVGAAGYGISPFRALDGFLMDRPCRVMRKVSAPIYVGGPAARFVDGRSILVGESAGQVKPTTAGGIMTSMAGAVAAAKWVCAALQEGKTELLDNYQREWESGFLKEMKSMLRLRGVLEKLSNGDLDAIVSALDTPKLTRRLSRSDFDFHATAILGSLGVPGLLRVAKVVASAEVRSLIVES